MILFTFLLPFDQNYHFRFFIASLFYNCQLFLLIFPEFDATVEVVPRRSLPLSQVGAEVASGVDADPRVAKDVVLAAATDADLPAETGKRRRGIIDRRGPSRRRLEGRNIREDQGREKDGNTPGNVRLEVLVVYLCLPLVLAVSSR